MNTIFSLLHLVLFTMNTSQPPADTKYYELRIYYCHPGRLDALISRFQNHTTKIFEKHGMENVGYWLPVDNTENALYYVLAYPSKEARDASWKAFGTDPEWKSVQSKSEESGKIVVKVTSVFMNASEVSPLIKPSAGKTDRTFELRTYYCHPGKLGDLITRFKDHSMKLLEKQGFTNIAYWTTVETDGSQPKLVYILASPGVESAKKSWDDFRADPVWVKAKADSEKNGPIVEKVTSVFMKPLPFSTIR
jgi:hypothetical protein